MDTSKEYYESIMRDYRRYGRGRTLEQYCHDEGADYNWIEKAKAQYGTTKQKKREKPSDEATQAPELIRLHFDPGQETGTDNGDVTEVKASEEAGAHASPEFPEWKIAGLRMLTPKGYEIEIKTTSPAAVTELLAGLIR